MDNKLANWTKYKTLNLRGNQLISTDSCFYLCSFCFGENIPTAEFGMMSAETACRDIERNYPNF
jgi:hypothetical protein